MQFSHFILIALQNVYRALKEGGCDGTKFVGSKSMKNSGGHRKKIWELPLLPIGTCRMESILAKIQLGQSFRNEGQRTLEMHYSFPHFLSLSLIKHSLLKANYVN